MLLSCDAGAETLDTPLRPPTFATNHSYLRIKRMPVSVSSNKAGGAWDVILILHQYWIVRAIIFKAVPTHSEHGTFN